MRNVHINSFFFYFVYVLGQKVLRCIRTVEVYRFLLFNKFLKPVYRNVINKISQTIIISGWQNLYSKGENKFKLELILQSITQTKALDIVNHDIINEFTILIDLCNFVKHLQKMSAVTSRFVCLFLNIKMCGKNLIEH